MRQRAEHKNVTLVNLHLELRPFEHSKYYKIVTSTMYSCPLYIFTKLHTNVKHYETTCRTHEPLLLIAYFWSYCPLNIEHSHFYHVLVSAL